MSQMHMLMRAGESLICSDFSATQASLDSAPLMTLFASD